MSHHQKSIDELENDDFEEEPELLERGWLVVGRVELEVERR
jgi:hypothetical protein